MKRVLLFLLFLGVGTAALVHYAGGIEGTRVEVPEPKVPVQAAAEGTVPSIAPGADIPEVRGGQGITQMAPPQRVVWKDRLSGEIIVVDSFFPWRFKTSDFQPLPMADGVKQGVLCKDVQFELYRKPATRGEMLALRDHGGREAYAALLHQRFQADEARVFGRLGEAVARTRERDRTERSLGDTMLRFTGGVLIEDRAQGVEIHGSQGTVLTVWPEQERALGQGPFTLVHEAFELAGSGLSMERDKAQDYARITIQSNPRLHIHSEGRGPGGAPLFDFGSGDFRPATVRSAGRAIIVREERRREIVLKVSFRDDVTGKQQGGGSLHAGRADLVAVKGPSRWRLRRFEADEGVSLEYPGRTRKGERYVATVEARRLVHEVPEEGFPTSVFEGFPVLTMRGEIAVLGEGGYLRATCRERAWIGPLAPGAPDGGLPRDALQQIGLRGAARIERHEPGVDGPNDALEGDQIDLVMWPKEQEGARPGAGATPADTSMVAVHFAAVDEVRIDGTRLTGATHRLVAEDLHTLRPRITAEGRDTHFSFSNLGRRQRLLGADTPGDASTDARSEDEGEGRWTLRRLLAQGRVDIDTSLGGPALGIPATLNGDEVAYDGVSNRAHVRALGPAPARLGWSASGTQTSTLETREITLDRAAGRIKADGGVVGEIYVRKGRSGGRAFDLLGPGAAGPALEGAVLTVRTDATVDIALVRDADRTAPDRGAEQVIRIAGPVTTELSSNARVVDRMRSDSLEAVLAFERRVAGAPGMRTVPIARAGGGGGAEQAAPGSPPADLQKIDIRAQTLRVDIDGKEARFFEAEGAVDLASADDHVEGERLTYDGATRRVEVHAGARPARVLLGRTQQRSEVTAERLVVMLDRGAVRRLEAHAAPGRTNTMELYRTDPQHPERLEWYVLTYEGHLSMTDALLTSDRVRVVRRLRETRGGPWGSPTVLRSPTLRITGTDMLASEEDRRVIREIVAEGTGAGRGGEVHFQSGEGPTLVQVWGHRFAFDVPGQRAVLTGQPGRKVQITYSDDIVQDHTELEIDLATNVPKYSQGSRMLWRPKQEPKRR